MKKSLAIFFVGGILGALGGAGGMLIVYPFIFPPPQVNEKVSTEAVFVAEATFREGASGQDAAHWGRGGLRIYEVGDAVLLELQDDFQVGAGPNFWLYLNRHSAINDEDDFAADEERVRLAKLKSFSGSQVYKISAADFARTRAITIWCDTFNQYIASADLPPKDKT